MVQELERLSSESEFLVLFVEYPFLPTQHHISTYWNPAIPVKPTFFRCLSWSLWPEMTLLSSSLTQHYGIDLVLPCNLNNCQSSPFYWTSGRNVLRLCSVMQCKERNFETSPQLESCQHHLLSLWPDSSHSSSLPCFIFCDMNKTCLAGLLQPHKMLVQCRANIKW